MSQATDGNSTQRFHAQYSECDLDDLDISFSQNVCWPTIAWPVESPEDMPGNGFFVDLGQLASAGFGNRPLTRLMRSKEKSAPQRAGRVAAPNWPLTLALAPSIRDWSQDKLYRTVKEEMSKLGWFYRFWRERSKLTPGFESNEVPCIDPELLERLDVGVGFEFADWLVLRGELSIETTRVRDLTKRISVPPKRSASKVAHGLYCKDAENPPEEVRILLPGEEFCPAESCYDCAWARCYDDSLPEIAHDILALRRDRDGGPFHLWQGSASAVRLQKLEELFARWPEPKQADAMELAAAWELPPTFLGTR